MIDVGAETGDENVELNVHKSLVVNPCCCSSAGSLKTNYIQAKRGTQKATPSQTESLGTRSQIQYGTPKAGMLVTRFICTACRCFYMYSIYILSDSVRQTRWQGFPCGLRLVSLSWFVYMHCASRRATCTLHSPHLQ